MAVNSVLQGSAADLIKKAMVDLDRRLLTMGAKSRLLIQVHDELLLELPEEEIEAVSEAVRECMEGAVALSVPLTVRLGTGRDWVEAHPV
jgi:DNA polymerase-1